MVSLPTKSTRDSLGINSYERGAAWAALMLRLIAAEMAAPFNQAVRVTADFSRVKVTTRSLPGGGGSLSVATPTPIFQFQLNLPYSRDVALRYGGNWIGSIVPISQEDCPTTAINFPRSGISEVATEPGWVDCLERYLAWCCWKLHSKLTNLKMQDPTFQGRSSMNIRFLDEAAYPTLQVSAEVGFDLEEFYAYGSVVAAINAGPGTTVDIGGGTPASNAAPDGDTQRPGGETGGGFNVRSVSRSAESFGDWYSASDFSFSGDI